jgi:hypothetical protein
MSEEKKKRSLWGLIAAGIVTAAVVIAAIGFIALLSTNGQSERPAVQEEPASEEAGSAAVETGGACDLPSGNMTTVPDDIAWETVGGISWPTSKTLGPAGEKDGFPVCFSHSPVGAALAAITTQFETLRHPPTDVGEFYLVDSPGKPSALESVQGRTSESQLSDLRRYGLTAAGFRVDEYTEDRALVYLVSAVPGSPTGFRGRPVPMVWVDGDWRAKVLDTGMTGQPIDVLDGQFTKWTD